MTTLFGRLYSALLCFFTIGIIKHKLPQKRKDFQSLSVIVAARNEEKNITNLLNCLVNQKYPHEKFEIVIADDRSQDNTAKIIKNFQKKYASIQLVTIQKESESLVGKKNALHQAIQVAKHKILVFTDADCLPSENWLREINHHFTEEIDFVAGYAPLIFKPKWLEMLKNLERASIFALTAGSFGWNWGITCVARNMAYRKSLYEKVHGFEGIGHLRSGDDDLMLQKMSPHIRNMRFMFSKDSFVPSMDEKNFNEQVHLETRRASKWSYYPFSIKVITVLVFCFYLLLGKLTMDAIFRKNTKHWLQIISFKICSEFILLSIFLGKINRKKLLIAFPLAEIIYIPYFLFFALKGTFGKYSWKN